ncbi:MAG TPA: phosphomannomutase/phosphoglucomutase [Acidimicrobiales bacterium]|nr:phosphomannomutase/phosphoglucomutase [Acidimicrobiales bacterium]
MASLADVFKAYDIRGTVPDQLSEEQFRAIGMAAARFAKSPTMLVARDMRKSGVSLSRAFAEGVRAEGVTVVDLGLASTDLLYFAAGALDAPGAMFTASHNPSQYNGCKLCLSGARPVGRDTGLTEIEATAEEILDRWARTGPPPVDPTELAPLEHRDLLEEYAAHVRSFVDVGALRPLRVVADVANGMGGLVAPVVFDGLPFEVEILFPELDGTFPNHPADPIQPENLAALRDTVLARSADVGLAFDGDADRVFLVDERAEPVSGSLTTALVASSMLDKHPGATILYNVICSRVVPETIAAQGGVGIRTKVGHSFIKQVMSDTGAVFGGEHSGHYYFRENYRADSGIIAAMVVLELVSTAGVALSALLEPFQRYADSGEINLEVDDPAGAVEQLAAEVEAAGGALGSVDRLDGLTVDRGEWWYNVRPSNTEPLLRLNVEAPDERSLAEHTAEVRAGIERVTGS